MIINEFHIASAIVFCLFLIFWFAFYDKAISLGNSFRQASRQIEKEYTKSGNCSFLNDGQFRLFRNRKLNIIWNRYCEDASPDGQEKKLTDIRDYFAPENLIPEIINVPLLNLMPFVFFAAASFTGAGAYLYRNYSGSEIGTDELWLIVIIAVSLLFSILMAVASKTAVYRAEKWIRTFVRWMTRKYCYIPDIRIQMQEMIRSLKNSIENNSKILTGLNESLALTVGGAIHPFIEETTDIINNFVSAATDKQVESMDNMAARFSAKTEEIYGEQIGKISSETSRMSGLQSELTDFLKEAALSSSSAAKSVESVTSLIQEVTAKYNDNLARLEKMNLSLSGSTEEFKALASFIRQNLSSEEDRIGSLAVSQKEILEVSVRANESLKAVAEDILKAGEVLKSSYGGITTDISQDIEKVFISFDENLSTISVHLSRSIQELQEAVDELPDILRRTARDL